MRARHAPRAAGSSVSRRRWYEPQPTRCAIIASGSHRCSKHSFQTSTVSKPASPSSAASFFGVSIRSSRSVASYGSGPAPQAASTSSQTREATKPGRVPQVVMPSRPPGASTRPISTRPATGSGMWKRTKASSAASKLPDRRPSRRASIAASGTATDVRAIRSMPGAPSTPTTSAPGAAACRSGTRAPTPVPTSRTRLAPARGNARISRCPIGRMTGLHSRAYSVAEAEYRSANRVVSSGGVATDCPSYPASAVWRRGCLHPACRTRRRWRRTGRRRRCRSDGARTRPPRTRRSRSGSEALLPGEHRQFSRSRD